MKSLKNKFQKRISFNYSRQKLVFNVVPGVFSSARVDDGTFKLIDSLRKNDSIDYSKALDMGCGYGPIGIFLKKSHNESIVYCVDRDALALDFAKQNAGLNDCKIEVYPSLDYENVKEKFSLICCNYPAKAGLKALKRFVWNASKHLTSNGIFAIVIVKELLEDFESILKEEIEVLHKNKSAGHLVFHLRFNKKISFDEDPYFREKIKHKLDDKFYELKTAFNIPEFESTSFTTNVMIDILKELKENGNISLIEPFQGHLAIAVEHYLRPRDLNLVSRDLLSLKYSAENLKSNGFKNFKQIHSANFEEKGDLLIWRLDEDIEFVQFKQELAKYGKNFERILIGGKKNKLKRFISLLDLKPLEEKEEKGAMAILV
jgi:16S rRNA (guanine1207-N2)-methyltransferase